MPLSGSKITIFGTDYPTPDGTCVRDYVHATDLGRAHVLGIEHLKRGGSSGPLNLGTGEGTSVRQAIEVAESVIGRPIQIEIGPRRAGDPPALGSKIGRAITWLNWAPVHSDLRTILGTAWKWIQSWR